MNSVRGATVALLCLTSTIAFLAACGGNDGGDITPEDLGDIILQRDDVPFGLQLDPTIQGDENSDAYGLQYVVQPELAVPGEPACLNVALALYHSESAADDAFGSVGSDINGLVNASTPEHTIERVQTHVIGDESDAFRTISQSTSFCAVYNLVAMDGYTFYFRDGEVLATVSVYNLESGASLDDAIQYADIQQARIEQFREDAR